MKTVDLPSDTLDKVASIAIQIGKAKKWQALKIYRLFKKLRKVQL